MDGLSAAASIIAVLQLTGLVIGYLNDVKDAPKECQQCTIEASNIQNLLINLRYRLEQGQADDAWFTAVRALSVENGPLDQYRQALEQLQSRVEVQDGVQKFKKILLWKFKKEEVASILSRIERLKSLVNIALEMDHFKLSKAIKDDTRFLRDTLPNLQADILTIRNTQHLQLDGQQLQQLQVVLDWLSPTDFPAQQHDIISRRQKGTGKWLLDSPEFKGWLQGDHMTLFCPGIPGAGKTMMAAIAIDYLGTLAQGDVGLAYAFCDYKSQVDQNLPGLLSALLKQLVQSRTDVAHPLTHLYQQHSKKRSRPSLDEIVSVLSNVCSNHASVYVVVDALDECTDQDGTRSQLIEKLRELQTTTNLRLLFTSRFITEITEKFRLQPMLEVRASEEDVNRFVAGQIPHLPRCIGRDNELTHAVQSKIVEAVDGMFLLARLYVDSLLDKRTKQKVQSTLEQLSKGTAALGKAYSTAIERIDGQLAEDRSLARSTISWLSYAQRPLTTQELCHALATMPGDKALNHDNFYDVDDIISVCAGLVTVDEESNVIRLVHYTTQEYFEQIRLEWNSSALEEIASTCLTYLSFETFRSGSCRSDEEFEERLEKSAFLDYAAQHWAEHVRPVEETVSELALSFLRDNSLVLCCTQVIAIPSRFKYEGYSRNFVPATTGLHLSARFGLVLLSGMLLEADYEESLIDVNVMDNDSRVPLSYAAKYGHEAVVTLLLDRDAKLETKDSFGQTPLSWAVVSGHEAVITLLLDWGAELETKDSFGRTPLSWAVVSGHEAVVTLLLDWDAELETKDSFGRTPLSWAAECGHEAVTTMLLNQGAELETKDSFGRTPLSWAAYYGHEAVVTLLLDRGAKLETKDSLGLTPLSYAAKHGHEAVVTLLLNQGTKGVK